ncbi:MAG TPA: DUF4339 domain-containing protein [Verrucomicrobiota bacterium]|nr:DUF4339 domain-containing protein [Verrucomicrobiota bacterium]
MMYKIIGADQKEYGPVSAEQLRQWLAEGRANAQTPVQAAGAAGWKPLAAYPEFAALLPADALAAALPPGYDAPRGLPEDIFARDYDLDIGGCLGRAWELLKGNFALVAGGVAVYLFSQIAISGLVLLCQMLFSRLTHTPFVEIAGNLVSLVITGPLTGGGSLLFAEEYPAATNRDRRCLCRVPPGVWPTAAGLYGNDNPDLPGNVARGGADGRAATGPGAPAGRCGVANPRGFVGRHLLDDSAHLPECQLDVFVAAHH